MKGRAVHAGESKGRGDPDDRQTGKSEIPKTQDLVHDEKDERRAHDDQKLPRRNGADDLVFDIDELRNNELLGHG